MTSLRKLRCQPVLASLASSTLLSCGSSAQTLLFDFDNAPAHSPLPTSLTQGGITAQFSATGQGFSIQPANTMGFTPSGFAGNCIYPSSVFASDLIVDFSQLVSDFSILYAPQELACDSSARMRVTAYRNGASVGSGTMTADPPGTWPAATLAIYLPAGFDRVVVHYDAPPPTGGDWGPIFMADNMQVTPGPPSLRIALKGPNTVELTWPSSPGWALQQNATARPVGWASVTNEVTSTGTDSQVVLPVTNSQLFYRLAHP